MLFITGPTPADPVVPFDTTDAPLSDDVSTVPLAGRDLSSPTVPPVVPPPATVPPSVVPPVVPPVAPVVAPPSVVPPPVVPPVVAPPSVLPPPVTPLSTAPVIELPPELPPQPAVTSAVQTRTASKFFFMLILLSEGVGNYLFTLDYCRLKPCSIQFIRQVLCYFLDTLQ